MKWLWAWDCQIAVKGRVTVAVVTPAVGTTEARRSIFLIVAETRDLDPLYIVTSQIPNFILYSLFSLHFLFMKKRKRNYVESNNKSIFSDEAKK